MPHIDDLKRFYRLDVCHLPDPTAINVVEILRLDTEYYEEKDHRGRGTGIQVPRHDLYFVGSKLPLRLNNTRLNALGEMLGKQTEEWVGRKIGLLCGTAEVFGKTQPAIIIHGTAMDTRPAVALLATPRRDEPAPRPATQPPAAAPPSLVDAAQTKPLPRARVEKFIEIAKESGGSWAGFIRWMKVECPDGRLLVDGVDLDAIPAGVVRAMGAYIKDIEAKAGVTPAPENIDRTTGEVITPAAAASPTGATPAAGRSVHPSVIAGAMGQPTPASPVPGATHGKPVDPDDDIPF